MHIPSVHLPIITLSRSWGEDINPSGSAAEEVSYLNYVKLD